MKKHITLKRMIIALSAVAVTAVGCIFLIMYAQRDVEEPQEEDVSAAPIPAVLITPKTYGSYGELMFAYIGENNYLYNLDDESKPLIEQPADELLFASDDTVIYTAPVETDAAHSGRESMIQELQIGEKENTLNTIATVSIDPCWSSNDEVVYFIEDSNKKQLCTFEPLTSSTEIVAEFDEEITALRISSDGLLATTASGQERLYIPLSKQLTDPYCDCQGSRIIVCEQYDLILSPEGVLGYRWMGSGEMTQIAENVIVPCGYQDNEVLYIQKEGDDVSLCTYYVSEEQNKELAKLPENILPQLTVSSDYAFMIDDSGIVYRMLMDNNEFAPFCQIEESVKNPLISVFDYRLMVYDISKEADATFSYAVDATVKPNENTVAELLAKQEAHTQEAKAESSGFATLEMASVGEAVTALQQKLSELGYMNAAPNGIYDIATMTAVQYLQTDLGLEANGIASPSLLTRINTEEIGRSTGYGTLSSTSKGIRIRDIQARLKTLGYLKENPTEEIDVPTEQALSLFAKDNAVEYDGGVIKPGFSETLFGTDAAAYSGILELQKGDICPAAVKLNARLKELHYLSGSVNPGFDAKTQTAVKLYQSVNRLTVTAKGDAATLKSLFAANAAVCPAAKAPAQIGDSASGNKTQVISDRQLKIIRKWLTKQFAVNHTDKQAVKRLQRQLVKLGFMKAQDVSMIYDQNTKNAVIAFQKARNLNPDGIVSKSTLTELYKANSKSTQEQ